jgi:hypothetical protein
MDAWRLPCGMAGSDGSRNPGECVIMITTAKRR